MKRKLVMIGVLSVLGLGASVVAATAGLRAVDPPKSETTRTPATSSGDLVEFRHEGGGFAISYPRGWRALPSSDQQVVLVASEREPAENRGGSLLARVVTVGPVTEAGQLAEAKRITDEVVTSGEGVELRAEPAQIVQAGLPGYFYFYTFSDRASAVKGAHSHYFLFKDQLMISLVFQALPETDFRRLAPVFDQIVASFRVL